MNSREQNIKNGAMAFAIVLAVLIIGIMCVGIYSVISWFSSDSDDIFTGESVYNLYVDKNLDTIIIDNSVGQLTIQAGERFEVSGDNVLKNFSSKYDDGTLTVKNASKKAFNFSESKSSITITIPKGTDLKLLEISTGAGNCTVTNVSTDKFNIETGAGNATIDSLTAKNSTIEAGAGNIDFNNSSLNDLTLNCGVGNLTIKNSTVSGDCKIDCGVGKFTLDNSSLYGDCDVDCGVGDFTLDINGNLEDYEIDISAAGKVKLNGKTYTKFDKLNKGADNTIKIDGGVGNISINIE